MTNSQRSVRLRRVRRKNPFVCVYVRLYVRVFIKLIIPVCVSVCMCDEEKFVDGATTSTHAHTNTHTHTLKHSSFES